MFLSIKKKKNTLSADNYSQFDVSEEDAAETSPHFCQHLPSHLYFKSRDFEAFLPMKMDRLRVRLVGVA